MKMTANYGVVKGYSEELVRVGSYLPFLMLTVTINAYCEEPPEHKSRPSRASHAKEQAYMGQHHCNSLYPLLVLQRNDAAKRNLVHLRRLSRRDEKSKELRSVEVPVVPIHELPRRLILGNPALSCVALRVLRGL